MGKRKKSSNSDSSEEDKKKKNKSKKEDKKKDKKKPKKEKKQSKKKDKKAKSSSSSKSSDREVAKQKPLSDEEQSPTVDGPPSPKAPVVSMWKAPTELLPVEVGILRFEYSADEVGPLGVKLSGGNPPMVLSVNPGTFAEKKNIPVNHEVHAINGFALTKENTEKVMQCLKARPVVLDLRPVGWKPQALVKDIEERRMREEVVAQGRRQFEESRRQHVEKEKVEREEREAAERAEQEEQDKVEREAMQVLAREARRLRKAEEDEWNEQINVEPEPWRRAAKQIMDAAYGTAIQEIQGRKGLPLRLVTRRKDVSWIWAGVLQPLIGGSVPEAFSEWTV